ncbi:MAG: hypothetical protein LBM96_04060 [Methanobrevibacter sp.]|jgi:hypothetical protein|nr:hypothetical protein [Candidatus Methanoflexus mossambicus]
MNYRTKTYIAADWSEDKDAVDILHKWNDNEYWSLNFVDAHNLTSARDNSLNCSIKSSLKRRLDLSKKFVLIVSNKTKNLRSGGCHKCQEYNSYYKTCSREKSIDYRSYIQYECDIANRDISNIVVLYNSTRVNKSLCPEILRSTDKHVAMRHFIYGKSDWNYTAVKNALI